MSDDDATARALDQLLSLAETPQAGVPGEARPAIEDPELASLVELAVGLIGMPAIPGPSVEFRAALAERIRRAPAPASVAPDARPAAASIDRHVPQGALQAAQALDAWLEVPHPDRPTPASLPIDARELAAVAYALEEVPAAEGPSMEFRRSLAHRLRAAPAPRALRQDHAAADRAAVRRLSRGSGFAAAAAATVALFLLSGATYASARAMPGEMLYPIKRGVESARLILADGAGAAGLHVQYADRRLSEALAGPDHAGAMLAEFSREATAALAAADSLVAHGSDRNAVAEPLLSWFRSARVRLVDGRPQLPGMAWRGALALVDEAIRALSSDGAFSAAAVPRMADYHRMLAAHGAATTTRADLRRSRRLAWQPDGPQAGAVSPTAPSMPGPTAAPRVVVLGADAPAAQHGDRSAAPSGAATAALHPPTEPTSPPQATPARRARPTAAPSRPAPTEPGPPSQLPPPTAQPTARQADPTLSPTPGSLTPPSTQAATATATAAVIDKPPTIVDAYCDDAVIDLFGSTECHVLAIDPEGKDLYYLWTADAPQMVNERQKDAVYYAAWGIGGGKMRVGIAVYVSDHEPFGTDEPNVARAQTYVEVRSLDASAP